MVPESREGRARQAMEKGIFLYAATTADRRVRRNVPFSPDLARVPVHEKATVRPRHPGRPDNVSGLEADRDAEWEERRTGSGVGGRVDFGLKGALRSSPEGLIAAIAENAE